MLADLERLVGGTTVSMTHEEYLSRDALALADAVRQGDVTATELLELALARLEAVNPQINAVVHLMEEDARRAAEDPADGPFAGVPFLAKDLASMYAGHPDLRGQPLHARLRRDLGLRARVPRAGDRRQCPSARPIRQSGACNP